MSMRGFVVVLPVVLSFGCASTPSRTKAQGSTQKFGRDPDPGHLADHCTDALVDGACDRVKALRTGQSQLASLHAAHMDAWRTAVERLRKLLAAGFDEPAFGVELPPNLAERWRSPDEVATIPVKLRIDALDGLERSRVKDALVASIEQLINLSENQAKEWERLLVETGAMPPEAIVAERAASLVEFRPVTSRPGPRAASVPAALLEPLKGVLRGRTAVVSLVFSEGDLRYRDVTSQTVPVPPALGLEFSEGKLTIEEQPAVRKLVALTQLKAPVRLACANLRAEIRFVDDGDWPARKYSVRARAAGGDR